MKIRFLSNLSILEGFTTPIERKMPISGCQEATDFYHSPDEYPPGGTRVRAGTFAAGDVSFDFSLEFELVVPFCTAGPLFCDSP